MIGSAVVLRPLQRAAVLGTGALALALVRIPGRPHTLCPLRATTGLPCPFCGGTTAAVDVGHGRLAAALSANPVVVLAAVLLVLAATPPGRHAVRSWRALSPRARVMLGGTVLAFSECWQLTRFGFL